jgi:hypothetical protein
LQSCDLAEDFIRLVGWTVGQLALVDDSNV